MINLIKTDTKRILKDKLFLVVCIIALCLSVFMPLLYKAMFSGMEVVEEDMFAEMFMISGKSLFFDSFSAGNNMGLIAPVFIAIIICKDFSQGTIRNKIICGKTRIQIFLSLFASCFIVLFGVILAHALVTLGISCLLFGYQATPFTFADFGYLLLSILFELLVYLCMSAVITLICTFFRNIGGCIVLVVAINLVFALIDGILMIGAAVTTNQATASVLEFFSKINIYGTSFPIAKGVAYGLRDILYILGATIFGTATCLTLGVLSFRKKNLK